MTGTLTLGAPEGQHDNSPAPPALGKGRREPVPEGRLNVSRGSTFYSTLLFATLLVIALPAAAKSWRISNFQDTITVNSDGSALVSETITLAFDGEWHGIHRIIPIEYPGPNGTNYQLFVDVTRVTDENGAKLK